MRQPSFATGLILALCIVVLASCSHGGKQPSAPTQTSQAERAVKMATQVAQQLSATRMVVLGDVQATATAEQKFLLDAPAWQPVIVDHFNDNANEWALGESDDPQYALIQRKIEQGVYRWEAKSYDGFVWWVIPDVDELSDFYAAVEAQQFSEMEIGEFGLIIRATDDDRYYLFEITQAGLYGIYYHVPGEWETLVDWTDTDLIQVENSNHLAVVAVGPEFHFLINGQVVARINDDRLPQGQTGVLVGLSNPDEQATWEFDDFEIRQP